MARTAVALTLAIAALCAPLSGLQAQTSKSIEDAPGYRTVPEAEPDEAGATMGSPGVFSSDEPGGAFGDGTLIIQAPGSAPASSDPAAGRLTPAGSYGQDQLEAFAQAAVKVQTIAQLWQPVIADAISSAEAMNLRQQANAEKVRAIQELGAIGPQVYGQINEAARYDPTLRAQIEALYQKAITVPPAGG